jgi:hypothetical protein
METYEGLELETIEFDAEDVITDSDGYNPTGPEEPMQTT